MRAIFMGAPAFAVPALQTLARHDVEIVSVYTKSPRPAGRRGLELTKTPVHIEAQKLGLDVRTPRTLRDPDALATLLSLGADIAVVAAYGLILPAEALSATRLGSFNLHASLLPRWRGAAPVQRALMAGDAETGVSIMRMEAGLDTGDIAGELRTPIGSTETAEEVTLRLSQLAAQTLDENWEALINGRLDFVPQREVGVTYARKIEKREAAINWTRPASEVKDHIRGLSPFPGAVTQTRGGERLKVLRAEVAQGAGAPGEILDKSLTIACGEGAVRALRVQRAGRSGMSGDEFMRSGAVQAGEVFTAPSLEG